jgi:hypothetical protein
MIQLPVNDESARKWKEARATSGSVAGSEENDGTLQT